MKYTAKVTALAIVLMFGASIVKADGIIIGRAEQNCTVVEKDGILVSDRATGIFDEIVTVLEGIIIGRKETQPCVEKNGILVSDRAGILVSD
ncbi:MAG: hypothetical protein ABL999_07160 [Pyrinomonadaceae bacterium]